MGQALLTKGCTKDLLERLKGVYELPGLPGKAPALEHCRRQLLKNQSRAPCTEHKSASCSIPQGQSQAGAPQQPMERCGCAQGCSTAPCSTAGSQLCSRHPEGMVCDGLFWAPPSSACDMLLFLLPSAAAAWGCCCGQWRCPGSGWGEQVPCPVL